MKKANISKWLLGLIGGVYLFVSLIIGIITGGTPAFWMGFGFFTFSVVVAFALSIIYGNSNTTIKDAYFNAPIYYIGIVYFAISGIVAVIQMLLGLFSFKALLIVQMIIFGVFVVYFILATISKTNAEEVNQAASDKNRFIRDMAARIYTIAGTCDDRDTKIKLEMLAEEFKYGTPAWNRALEEIENGIKEKVGILNYQLESKEYTAANETIANIKKMVIERNRMAKV